MPYVLSVFAMIAWAASSDRNGERIWHTSLAALLAAVSLFAAALLGTSLWSVIALSLAIVGIYAALTVFWTLPPSFLAGTAAAGGIALINSIANLGGFFGPYIMGWLKTTTGGYSMGFAVLAIAQVASALLILMSGRSVAVRAAPMKA
jgi:ACS family tartrate transporter-like MFS transporter